MPHNADGLKELFAPFAVVTVKRMFGGHGIYSEELCFAIEADGEVYLKCDAEAEPTYVAAGSSPFVYTTKGREMTMAYWRLPASAYDDAQDLRRWAELGFAAARRAALAKAKKPGAAKAKAPAMAAGAKGKSKAPARKSG